MGAWNTTSFGNDAAISWLQEMIEADAWPMVDEAFTAVLGVGDEMLDEEAAQEGIAACEVIAWLLGHPSEDEDSDEQDALQEWVLEQEFELGKEWVTKAKKVIDRAYNHPSELREFYEESDDLEDWQHHLADLKRRLEAGIE